MKKEIYIALICTLLFNSVKGQEQRLNLNHNSNIIIRGKTIDSGLFRPPKVNQNLFLAFPIIASVYSEVPVISEQFNLEGYGSTFEYILKSKSNYSYVNFVLETSVNKGSWSYFDNMYILEKGDNIDCILSSDYFQFSGKGSDKLNCQSAIYKIKYNYKLDSNEFFLKKEKRYQELFESQDKKRDSILNLQLKIVANYAPKIGKNLTEIMIANCYGLRYYTQLLNLFYIYPSNPDYFKEFLRSKTYKEISLNIIPNHISKESLIAAPVYANALLTKLRLDNMIDQNNEIIHQTSDKVAEKVYNDIKSKYQGPLREKLILLFFYKFENDTIMKYHDEAMGYLTSQEFKDALLKIRKIRTKGMLFFPFELEDYNGKLVKLSDFNQNVVILDFWFTGCHACTDLYNGMKPIYEKYRNHPKVKFVTISIDKNKESWKQSVDKEQYTDKNHINLYTGGLGNNHPLIREYQISAYPKLFILQNGSIFSQTPPYPMSGTTNKHDELRFNFTKLVQHALNGLLSPSK